MYETICAMNNGTYGIEFNKTHNIPITHRTEKMYALVYLNDQQRIRIWTEGGYEQEVTTDGQSWLTCNREDWSHVFAPAMIVQIREILQNKRNQSLINARDALVEDVKALLDDYPSELSERICSTVRNIFDPLL